MMKKLNFILLAALLGSLSSCRGGYSNEITYVSIINRMQSCEEDNIHYTVVGVDGSRDEWLVGKIVLPVLSGNLDTEVNREIFFPARSISRLLVRVKGHMSLQAHTDLSKRCSTLYKSPENNFSYRSGSKSMMELCKKSDIFVTMVGSSIFV